METNINSILSRLRNLIYSNKIEEASIIAEPYTVATNYVLQHCNHKLDPIYKDFTVFKHKYSNPRITGNGLGHGNWSIYGDGFGNGYGNSFGNGVGYGFGGYGNGFGHGNWSSYGNGGYV